MRMISNRMLGAISAMLIVAVTLIGTLIVLLAPVVLHPDPLAPGDTDFDRASAMVLVAIALSVVMMPMIYAIHRDGQPK